MFHKHLLLLCYVDKTFSIIPAKAERLMFRNDREIEVRDYKDKIVIVRKNDVFEKGGAVSSKKNVRRHRKTNSESHKLLHQSGNLCDKSCSLLCKWHTKISESRDTL